MCNKNSSNTISNINFFLNNDLHLMMFASASASTNNAEEMPMFSAADVAVVRHVVQRILVPCVFVIGLLGNSVSICVLTRKRMRCTTNIYLTALAITDIIYLAMALLLSLKHYEYVQRNCEAYWKYYGIVVWLCDACAYISIYIAVCFTIERFIAIRYPLKRQTFCTESLAKKVIAGVALFCLLSTISTAFEHQYRVKTKLVDIHGNACNATLANASERLSLRQMNNMAEHFQSSYIEFEGSGEHEVGEPSVTVQRTYKSVNQQQPLEEKHNEQDEDVLQQMQQESTNIAWKAQPDAILRRLKRVPTSMAMEEWMPPMPSSAHIKGESLTAAAAATDIPNFAGDYLSLGAHSNLLFDAEFLVSAATPVLEKAKDMSDIELPALLTNKRHNDDDTIFFNITDFCENITYYQNSLSSLAENALYTRLWYFFTLFVFVLIPLCVLATFNCFLIMLVRRSKNLRGEMTNACSIRRSRRKPHSSSVSQENRITVTLIAVVLFFIICQLPWAIYLIVSENMDIDVYAQAIIGNIFNFLAAINAAANFFLYCVLSDKYRKTVRELITGYRYRVQRNTSASASLYTSTHASAMNGSRRFRPTASSIVVK